MSIYRDTVTPLYRFVARRVNGERTLAEDVTQETFLRAVERWTADGVPDVPLAWLQVVARNLIRNVHRRRTPDAVDADAAQRWLDPARPDAGPREVTALVQWGLAQLADHHARLIESFHLDARSVREIATEHNRTEKAIERRLDRARTHLRRVLAPHLEPDRAVAAARAENRP